MRSARDLGIGATLGRKRRLTCAAKRHTQAYARLHKLLQIPRIGTQANAPVEQDPWRPCSFVSRILPNSLIDPGGATWTISGTHATTHELDMRHDIEAKLWQKASLHEETCGLSAMGAKLTAVQSVLASLKRKENPREAGALITCVCAGIWTEERRRRHGYLTTVCALGAVSTQRVLTVGSMSVT